MKNKKMDILLLVLFPLFAVIVSLSMKTNYLISTLLFFGLPGLYLSFRNYKIIPKSIFFAVLLGFPFATIINSVAALSNSWLSYTVFDFKFLGLIPLEDFIFATLFVYLTIIFYENLLDKCNGNNKIDRKLKLFIIPLTIVFLIFFILVFRNLELLHIPYSCFWIGFLVGLLPLAAFLSFFSKFFCKFIKSASYLFLLTLLFELTVLQLNQWAFPEDSFLFWIGIGEHRFPFEELFFWMMLVLASILTYYEFFIEDKK